MSSIAVPEDIVVIIKDLNALRRLQVHRLFHVPGSAVQGDVIGEFLYYFI